MTTIDDLKTGQIVYIKWIRRAELEAATVDKVGRKWVAIGRNRLELGKRDLYAGKGISLGRVYLSREEYENEQKDDLAWREIRGYFSQWSKPAELTWPRLQSIAEIIGVALPGFGEPIQK